MTPALVRRLEVLGFVAGSENPEGWAVRKLEEATRERDAAIVSLGRLVQTDDERLYQLEQLKKAALPPVPDIKFDCPRHGLVDHLFVDGYGFGDRLLEGCLFKVTVNERHEYTVLDEEEMLHDLDVPVWMRRAHEYVAKHDLGQCPVSGCDQDVSLQPWDDDPEMMAEYRAEYRFVVKTDTK